MTHEKISAGDHARHVRAKYAEQRVVRAAHRAVLDERNRERNRREIADLVRSMGFGPHETLGDRFIRYLNERRARRGYR